VVLLSDVNSTPFYEKWLKKEQVPVTGGLSIPNLKTLPLQHWDRLGGPVMYLKLDGTEGLNDSYVAEIPAGGSLKVERHLYEEVIFILKGRGATSVWYDEDKKVTFEWKAGSLFMIPPNAFHQHINGQGSEAARFYAVTTAPLVLNLYHNEDFVFNNDFRFTDRFDAQDNFYNGEGTEKDHLIWDTNFIADIRSFPLKDRPDRGAKGKNRRLELGNNSMIGHVSEFPVGTYKKGHRHGPGAHVIIVSGHGYSLLWKEGEEKTKIDWEDGSVLVPPNMVFHQHFNTSPEPARYLAIRWGSRKYPVFPRQVNSSVSLREGGNQIEYEDEEPEIRQFFEKELAKHGAECRMPPIDYNKY
jgi:oxalate decarboxylase/phosphoglucose isomerase-like protein (cupin superfamily)